MTQRRDRPSRDGQHCTTCHQRFEFWRHITTRNWAPMIVDQEAGRFKLVIDPELLPAPTKVAPSLGPLFTASDGEVAPTPIAELPMVPDGERLHVYAYIKPDERYDGTRYTNHFVNCPQSKQHSRTGRR